MNTEKFQERFKFYRDNFSQEELAKLLALKETEDQEPAPTTVIEPYPVYPTYPPYPAYPSLWEPLYTFRPHIWNGPWEITCQYNPNEDSTTNETH